ncbi:hypothetical protein [Bacteroides pyogenes]|uniref:hypothetical protein n=1 Tax=Bacteroides pyogenes TaxID=310300 RepID=UPI001BA719C5|nr:hypothetical protein [Bacteroides pyogenes]MBR8726263.1 hypothetical protein [Bacteroides pyogenes]MBR8740108.1 hypothetical protein [Bacteroides pyogenes]MBR8755437.1 hypothetical protein [Bacteroides pyogenes]MBR8796743.1 hypothetical protein [Bacteroides pyogenes]MBR8810804.1 hypothetical protein [Bacteroides pyogenes]
MATIRTNAEEILKENYRQGKHEISFMEWLELESENDPYFWMWLFNDENLESPTLLTDEHRQLYIDFLKECE